MIIIKYYRYLFDICNFSWAVKSAHQFSQNRIPGADAIEQKIQEPVLLGWGDERESIRCWDLCIVASC